MDRISIPKRVEIDAFALPMFSGVKAPAVLYAISVKGDTIADTLPEASGIAAWRTISFCTVRPDASSEYCPPVTAMRTGPVYAPRLLEYLPSPSVTAAPIRSPKAPSPFRAKISICAPDMGPLDALPLKIVEPVAFPPLSMPVYVPQPMREIQKKTGNRRENQILSFFISKNLQQLV